MRKGKPSDSSEPVATSQVLQFGAPPTARRSLQKRPEGACRMLQKAFEAKVNTFAESHSSKSDSGGRRLVVRNGYMPVRELVTGAGNLEVEQPRVRDKSPDRESRVRFSSNILPPYLRRWKSIDELIPWLYIKGIYMGDFSEALQSLTGGPVAAVRAATTVRLKETWSQDYDA